MKHALLSIPYLLAAAIYSVGYSTGYTAWLGVAVPAAMVLGSLLALAPTLRPVGLQFFGAASASAAFLPLTISTNQALELWWKYPDLSHLMALLTTAAGSIPLAAATCAILSLLADLPSPSRPTALAMALIFLSVPPALAFGQNALYLATSASFALSGLTALVALRYAFLPYAVMASAALAHWIALPDHRHFFPSTAIAVGVLLAAEAHRLMPYTRRML